MEPDRDSQSIITVGFGVYMIRCRQSHAHHMPARPMKETGNMPTTATITSKPDWGERTDLLLSEWDYEKNDELGLDAMKMTRGSKKKVGWRCGKCNHKWLAIFRNRVNGMGCGACAGKVVIAGRNDFASVTKNVQLLREWDYLENDKIGLHPSNVTAGSDKRVHWRCEKCNHTWVAKVKSRNEGRGCRKCDNKAKSLRSIQTCSLELSKHKKLLREWDYSENDKIGLHPSNVTTGSNKQVHWQCEEYSHKWYASVNSRTRGNGCRECADKKRFLRNMQNNSFELFGHAKLLHEWDYSENDKIGLHPSNVTTGSDKKVHWRCERCDYGWQATVGDRTKGNGCPGCRTGKTERAFIESFTNNSFVNMSSAKITLSRASRKTNLAQIDGINEELMFAFEYDGHWTHSGVASSQDYETMHNFDCETTEALLNAGYRVVRVREIHKRGKLPFLEINPVNLIDPAAIENLLQVSYKSYGTKRDPKDDIDTIVKEIIALKPDWFTIAP